MKFSTTGNVMEWWRRSRLALGVGPCDFNRSDREMLNHSRWKRFTVLVDFVVRRTINRDKDMVLVSTHFYSIPSFLDHASITTILCIA